MPFGGESYADATEFAGTHQRVPLSPVPFGGESYADHMTYLRGREPWDYRLQCLSAVSPMRTQSISSIQPAAGDSSPVPFGGESYADVANAISDGIQASASPVPFGGESYADMEDMDCGLGEAIVSPVPFGGESYADEAAIARQAEAKAMSPVPFGGESYADQIPAL